MAGLDDGATRHLLEFRCGDRVRMKHDSAGDGVVVAILVRTTVEYVVRFPGGEDYVHGSALEPAVPAVGPVR